MPTKKEYKLSNRYNAFEIKECLDEALTEVFLRAATTTSKNKIGGRESWSKAKNVPSVYEADARIYNDCVPSL